MNVLIAAPVDPVLTDGLSQLGYRCMHNEQITQDVAADLVKDCAGIITSTRLQLDQQLIDAAPFLQWIGRMGSGMEVIDVPYAQSKGIKCFSSPEGNCNAVGEHALGMLLSLMRRISWSQEEIKHGLWLREENRGTELEGKTVAIIGFGHTGSSFARKLAGFDVNIIAYDKYDTSRIPDHITTCSSLEHVYREADILSFHVPLQHDTKHYFNRAFLDNMAKPFVLINTSRGPVVDTDALRFGLASGSVVGACLDVFEGEPPVKMNKHIFSIFQEIIVLPNVVATPHIGGYTFEALYKMSKTLLDKIAAGVRG